MDKTPTYVIEMLHITKEFPGIKANDDITLQLKKGEIHALLGENGAGKSTLMSVLFGLYQPEAGEIRKNGQTVKINDPNDATALGIGMVHQHFKLVEVFSVLDNIILGAETTKCGFLQKKEARRKVEELSKRYGLHVDLDAKVEDITVGMQQRTEILKMLYRDNEILIFDEPTAVLTPQEIDELMAIMKNLTAEGKSILFISHKLNEIMAVADRVTVLRKGRYVGTVNTCDTNKQELSNMMVGRPVQLEVVKEPAKPTDVVLKVRDLCVPSHTHKRNAVDHVSFDARAGEILCIAGIDGNGQTEFIHALTGLDKSNGGTVTLCGKDISHASIRRRGECMSHIPEDRHKHGLVLDFTLEQNLVLQRYKEPEFEKGGFIKKDAVRAYANADSVAELTVALFLLLQRRLYEANEGCRAGRFTSIAPRDFLGTEILGKTFGQIGMGNIAQRIAHIMHNGFGVKVLGYDPFIDAEEAARRGFEKVDTMEELLERSDMVNINVPLVPSTKGMISRAMFDHFKPGAVFVNAARGAVIDEDALYDALVSGKLKAAACDTFVNEPPTGENKLLSLPNFSATPHIGGNTVEALEKAGTLGPVIPPSLMMIFYGVATGEPITKLLMSGVVPGILTCILLCLMVYIIAKKRDMPVEDEPFSWKRLWDATKDSVLALLMPIIILVTIYFGICTATESAAIAAVYGIIIA